MKKSFIRSKHLGIILYPISDNHYTLLSSFLQCCVLSEFVTEKPESFVIEEWESSESEEILFWKNSETTFHGVVWGEARHTNPDEMSACLGSVDFVFASKTQNSEFENVRINLPKGTKMSIWELVELTKGQ